MTNRIEHAVDTVLSGLTTTPERRAELVRAAILAPDDEPRGRQVNLKVNISLSFRLYHLLAALLIVLLVTALPLLTTEKEVRFTGWQSEDGQTFIFGPTEQPQAQSHAARAVETTPPMGRFRPGNMAEAEACYGTHIPMFTWLPEGAQWTGCTVIVDECERSFDVRYKVGEKIIAYSVVEYLDEEPGNVNVFQDGEGEYITLSDGREVYITTNYQYQSIVWSEDYTVFIYSGAVSRGDAIRMVESIE